MHTAFILIVSNQPQRREQLRDLLRERYGHSCHSVDSFPDALDSIRARTPDVVITDGTIDSDDERRQLVGLMERLARDATLVTIGGSNGLPAPDHVRLVHLPARDNPADLLSPIHDAATRAAARRDDRMLRESVDQQNIETFEGIVGVSPAIQRIKERIKKAAKNKLTVLILGETGTGKELIARAIHKQSDRSRKAFKELNCAGLNENLLESALFGHVRGAFTGAVADAKGYFVAADGGSLFLDEIGDMPLTMQAKLLRALEQREITPVGSTEVRKVDVRVIAATNIDLRRAVDERKFRDDLYYRLHQWEILVPPLRERRPDIPVLSMFLLQKANGVHGLSVPGLSSGAMNLLTRYLWPGNVRELENVLAAVACEVADRQIEADDLPEHIRGSREIVPISAGGLVGLKMNQIERLAIEKALQATEGNRDQAAKMLGIGTRTLYRKIKEFGL